MAREAPGGDAVLAHQDLNHGWNLPMA